MALVQKPDFIFRRNGRVHLNRPGGGASVQSTAGTAEVCGISGSNAGYTVFQGSVKGILATHCIRQFPLHYPSRASPCAITFQLNFTVLATHSIRQFPLHYPSRASPCAITFQLNSTVLATHSIRQFPLHFPSRASPCAITFQPNCTLDTS